MANSPGRRTIILLGGAEITDEFPAIWHNRRDGDNMKASFAVFLALCFAGCSSTGVVPMNQGTYLIAKKEAQLGIGPPIAIKGEAYSEANAFCAAQGRQIETVDYQETGAHIGRMAAVSLEFRCVAKKPE